MIYFNKNFTFSHKNFISKTLLSCLATSEESLIEFLMRKKESNIQQIFGILSHLSFLEPKKFPIVFQISDSSIKDKNNKNQYLISPDSMSNSLMITESLKKISNSNKELVLEKEKKIKCEVLILKAEKKYHFGLKGFIDLLLGNNLIVEIKTIGNIKDYKKHLYKYDYDLQAFLYIKIMNTLYNKNFNMKIRFVEKSVPWSLYDLDISEDIISSGEKKFEELIYQFIEFIEKRDLYYSFVHENIQRILDEKTLT